MRPNKELYVLLTQHWQQQMLADDIVQDTTQQLSRRRWRSTWHALPTVIAFAIAATSITILEVLRGLAMLVQYR